MSEVLQSVIAVDENILEKVKNKISKEGINKFHVVADFDRTLTYGASEDGKTKTSTIISQLRSDPKYLGQAYFDEAHVLYDFYHPFEIDIHLSLSEKKEKMHEWWRKHFELIARSGLTRNIIKQVVKERPLRFRKGVSDFLELLYKKGIPLVIISAAVGDMIIEYLKQKELYYNNIHVVGNRYRFDKEGNVTGIQEPIVHVFNKDETVLEDLSFYEKFKGRGNVLLLGDSLGDEGMIEGFPYKNLIKVGFLNEETEKNLYSFRKAYDVILTGDQDFDYVNSLLEEMFGK